MEDEIRGIMERHEATQDEARVIYHLREASRSWNDVVDAEPPENAEELNIAFLDNYAALSNTVLAHIHRRLHPPLD